MSVRQVLQRARTPAGISLASGMILSALALIVLAWQLAAPSGRALLPGAGSGPAPSVPAAPPPVHVSSPARPGGGAPGVPGRHSRPPGGTGVIAAPGPGAGGAPGGTGGSPGAPPPGPSRRPSPQPSGQPSGQPSPSPSGPQPSPPPGGQPCTIKVSTFLVGACVYATLLAP